jgi:hypothetical protein
MMKMRERWAWGSRGNARRVNGDLLRGATNALFRGATDQAESRASTGTNVKTVMLPSARAVIMLQVPRPRHRPLGRYR